MTPEFSRGLKAAVIGGTVSKATGGKFANGAITGAFASAVREGVQAANQGNRTMTAEEYQNSGIK